MQLILFHWYNHTMINTSKMQLRVGLWAHIVSGETVTDRWKSHFKTWDSKHALKMLWNLKFWNVWSFSRSFVHFKKFEPNKIRWRHHASAARRETCQQSCCTRINTCLDKWNKQYIQPNYQSINLSINLSMYQSIEMNGKSEKSRDLFNA